MFQVAMLMRPRSMTSSPPASVIGAVVAAETLHSPDEASSPPPSVGRWGSMPMSVKTPLTAMS